MVLAIYDRASAADRVGRSVATIRRWEKKGWLTFTMNRVREADLLEAEKVARSNHGGARIKKEGTMTAASDQLEEANWPDGAVADGKVYSLEASPAMSMTINDGVIEWVPREPNMSEPPEFQPMTGTYGDVSRRAVQYNAAQQRSGFCAWIFYPSPLEPQGAR